MEWNPNQPKLIPNIEADELRKYISLSSSGNMALIPYYNTNRGFVKYMTYQYDGAYRPWKRIGNASRSDRTKDIIGDPVYAEIDSNRRNYPNCFGNAVWSADDKTMIIASTEEIRIYDYSPPDAPLFERRDLWLDAPGDNVLTMPRGDGDQIPRVAISGDGTVVAWSRKGHHLIRIAMKKSDGWREVNEINVGKRNVNFAYSMALNKNGSVLAFVSEDRGDSKIVLQVYNKDPNEDQWKFIDTTDRRKYTASTDIERPDTRQLRSISISDDGKVILVGCLKNIKDSKYQAIVYRYQKNTIWALETIPINAYTGDYTVFLSPDGNTATITSQYINNDIRERTVYVYKYHPNIGWTSVGNPIKLESANNLLNYSPVVVSGSRLTYVVDVDGVSPILSMSYTASPYPAAYGYWDKVGTQTTINGSRAQDKLGYAAAMSMDGTTIVTASVGEQNIGEVKVYAPSKDLSTLIQKGNTIKGTFAKGLLGNTVSVNNTGTIVSMGSINGISENYEYFPRFTRFKAESGIEGAIRFLKYKDGMPHFDGRSGGRPVDTTTVKISNKTFPFIDTEGNVVYDTGDFEFTGKGRIYDDHDRSISFFSTDMLMDASTLILEGKGTWDSATRGTIEFVGRFKIHGTTRWSESEFFGNDFDDDVDQSGEYRFDLVPADPNYLNVSGSWLLQFGGRMLPDFLGSNGYGRKIKNVAMSSDATTLLVGEPDSNNPLGGGTGQVEIFKFINGGWQWKNFITGAPGEAFGHSVATNRNGSIIAIGTIVSKTTDLYKGIVRLYQRQSTINSAAYTQIGPDIIGENVGDAFGYAIAINDTAGIPLPGEDFSTALQRHSYITIGAPYYDTDKLNTGKIYRYSLQSNSSGVLSWKLDSFTTEGTFSYDYYGKCVSMSANGNTIAIGAPSEVTGGFVSTIDYPIKSRLTEDIQSTYNKECLGMSVAIAEGGYGTALMTSSPMYSIKNLAGGQVSLYTLKPFVFATVLNREPNQYDPNIYAIDKTTGYLFNKVNDVWKKTTIYVPLSEQYQNVVVSYGKPGRNYTKPQPICFDLRNNLVYRRQGTYDWSIIKKILKYILRGNVPPTNRIGDQDDYYLDVQAGLLYGPKNNGIWGARKPFKLNGIKGNESIFVGSFTPDLDDGNIGDYYINLVDAKIYGPKTSTSWPIFSTFHKTVIMGSETYINKNLGTNNDYYLNISSGEFTGPKSELGWSTDPFRIPIADLSKIRNRTIYFGFDNSPNDSEGVIGDYYANFNEGILFGPKTSHTSWNIETMTKVFMAKPALKGEQAPLSTDGIIGDYYINIDTLDFYGPKTTTGWGPARSKFPLEISLYSVVLISRKAPKEIEGREGEYFVNIVDQTLYGPKAASAGSEDVSLWGPNRSWSKTALVKSNDPVSNDGFEGDYCYNSTSLELFVKSRNGINISWTSCNVKLVSGITSLFVGVYKDPTEFDGVIGSHFYNRFTNQLFGPKSNKLWLEATSTFGNQIVRTVTEFPTDDIPTTEIFNVGRTLLNTSNRKIYRFLNSKWEKTCSRLPASIPTNSTIITGIANPISLEGTSGTYYYNVVANTITGPKTSSWNSSGVPMDIVAITRNSNPKSQELSNGDYVYNSVAQELYGPKKQFYWPLVSRKFRDIGEATIHIVSSNPSSDMVTGDYYYNTTTETLYFYDGTLNISPTDNIVYSKQYKTADTFGLEGQYVLDADLMTLYGPKTATTWNKNGPYKLPNSVKTEGKIITVSSLANSNLIGTTGDFIINTTDATIHGPKKSDDSYPSIGSLYKVAIRITTDPVYDTYGNIGDYAYDINRLLIWGPKLSNITWMGAAEVRFVNFIEEDADIIIGMDDTLPDAFGKFGDYYFSNGAIRGYRNEKSWIALPQLNPNKRIITRYDSPLVFSDIGVDGDYWFDLNDLTLYGPKTTTWVKILKLPGSIPTYVDMYYGLTSDRTSFTEQYFLDTEGNIVSQPGSSDDISKKVLETSNIPPIEGEFKLSTANSAYNEISYTISGFTERLRIPKFNTPSNSVIISGQDPVSVDGIFGDYAFNQTTYKIFGPKVDQVWQESIEYWKDIVTGSVNPTTASVRKRQNFYLNTTTRELFTWDGTQWTSLSLHIPSVNNIIFNDIGGPPSDYIGVDGDYYFDAFPSRFHFYGPKTGGVWPDTLATIVHSALKIPFGTPVIERPGAYIARVEDNGATDSLYISGPGSYGVVPGVTYISEEIKLSGIPKNTIFLVGYGEPPVDVGQSGDYYLDDQSQIVYGPKTTTWGTGISPNFSILDVPSDITTSNNVYVPPGSKYISVDSGSLYTHKAPNGLFTRIGTSNTLPTFKANGLWRDTQNKRVLITSDAATDTYGRNGDYYFNTTTTTMYGPKFENVWPTYGIKYDLKYKPNDFYIFITTSVQDIDNNNNYFNAKTLDVIGKLVIDDYYFDPIKAELVQITFGGKYSIPKVAVPESTFIKEVSHGAWYVNSIAKKLYGPYNDQGWNLGMNVPNNATILIGYRNPNLLDGKMGDYYYNSTTGGVYSAKSKIGWQPQVSFDVKIDFTSRNGWVYTYDRKTYSQSSLMYASRLFRGLQVNKIFVGDGPPDPKFGTFGSYYLTSHGSILYGPKVDPNSWTLTDIPWNMSTYSADGESTDYRQYKNLTVVDGYSFFQQSAGALGMFPLDVSYHFPTIFPTLFDLPNESSLFSKYLYLFDPFKNKIKTRDLEYRQGLDIVKPSQFSYSSANYLKQTYSIDGLDVKNLDRSLNQNDFTKIGYILPNMGIHNVMIVGIGSPPIGFGVTGDYYVNTITNTIYGPKNGLWNKHPIKTAKWIISKILSEQFMVDEGDYIFEKTSRTLFTAKDQESIIPRAIVGLTDEIIDAQQINIVVNSSDISLSGSDTTYNYAIETNTFHKMSGGVVTPAVFANIAIVEYQISKHIGTEGDFCFETSTNRLYGPKTGINWPLASKLSYKITNEERMYIGSGLPDDTIGNPDDFYFDKTNTILYGPKDIGGWAVAEVIREIIKVPNQDTPLDSQGTVGDYILMLQSARVYGPKEDLGWPVTYMKYPEYINSSLRIAVISRVISNYSELNDIDVYLHDNDTENLTPYKFEDGQLVLYANPGTWLPKGNAITYDQERYIDFKGGMISGDPDSVRVLNDTLDTNCMVMSADGKTIAVSSFSEDAGVVRVFQYVNTKWVQKGESIYGSWHEDFGYSLSISDDGNVIAIGAQNRCEERSNMFTLFQSFVARVGQVYVYRFDNKIWTKDFDYTGKREIGRCGYNVSLNSTGDVLAFSEPGHLRSKVLGRLRVVKYNSNDKSWSPYGEMENNSTSRAFRDNIIAGATAGITVGLLIATLGPLFGPFGPIAMVASIVGSVLAGVLTAAVITTVTLVVDQFTKSDIDRTFLENSGRFHHGAQIDLSSNGKTLMVADFRRNDFIPEDFIEKTSGTKALNFISSNIDVINFITTQAGELISSLYRDETIEDPDDVGNTRKTTSVEVNATAVVATLTIGGQFSKRTSLAAIIEEDTNWTVVGTQKTKMIVHLKQLEKIANILDRSEEGLQAIKWAEESRQIKFILQDIGAKPGYVSKFMTFLKAKFFADTPPGPIGIAVGKAIRFVTKYIDNLVTYLKTTKIFQHVTKTSSKLVKNISKAVTPIGKGLKNCSKLMKVAKFMGKVSIVFTVLTFPSGLFDGFEYADMLDQAVSNSSKGMLRIFHLMDNNKWEQATGPPQTLKANIKIVQNLPIPPGLEMEVSSALLTGGVPVADGATIDLSNLKISDNAPVYISANVNNVYRDGSYNFVGNEDLFASSASLSRNGQRIAVLAKHSLPGFVDETKDLPENQVAIGIYRMDISTKIWFPLAYIIVTVAYPKLHQDLFIKLNEDGTKLIVGDPFYSASDTSEFCGLIRIFTIPITTNIIQILDSSAEQIVGEYPYAQLGNPSTIAISNDGSNIAAAKRNLLPNIIVEVNNVLIETSKHVSVYIRA